MSKLTHEQLVKIALSRPGVKKAYNAMEAEFALLDEILREQKKVSKIQWTYCQNCQYKPFDYTVEITDNGLCWQCELKEQMENL